MSENEEVHEPKEQKSANPPKLEMPEGYRLGASRDDFWHSVYYSDFAWIALVFAQVASAIGCIAILCFGVYWFFGGVVFGAAAPVVLAIVVTPFAFLIQFAQFVVFGRVAELKSESRHSKRPG